MAKVRVVGIKVSDGTDIEVPNDGVVLLVGPNNAGKSQVLKDLLGLARDERYAGKAVVEVRFAKSGGDGLEGWMDALPQITRDGITRLRVEGWGDVTRQDIAGAWNSPRPGVLTGLFILHADGTSRLGAGNAQSSLDFAVEPASHPIQRAYENPEIERQLDEMSRAAFGLGVTVDRFGGATIALRLGAHPQFEHDDGRPKKEYLNKLRSLPRLEEQGDGVRSYLGLLLYILAGSAQITLVDEPEAFLHPPQARLLGRVLAERTEAQQAFIATHSSNVVQGALEAEALTTIVRITRRGNINHAAVLKHDAVKELWADPLLRYSNVLDGLFHDAVILCEGDADCRYYSAVLDNLSTPDLSSSGVREPQLLFTHSGGKGRMAAVVRALRAVSVPVVAVCDFDILKDPGDVRRLLDALGGNFQEVESDLKLVASALTADVKPLKKLILQDSLKTRLDEIQGELIDQRQAESLRSLIRADSGWDKAKRAGKTALPQGSAFEAFERLKAALNFAGLLVVPVGELERFAPGVAGHGPGWVTSVLEAGLHKSPGNDAVEFVGTIRAAAARKAG